MAALICEEEEALAGLHHTITYGIAYTGFVEVNGTVSHALSPEKSELWHHRYTII